MQLDSKTHIRPLLTTEFPVAHWLEHPTRSRRVVGKNAIRGSDCPEFPVHSIVVPFHVICNSNRNNNSNGNNKNNNKPGTSKLL